MQIDAWLQGLQGLDSRTNLKPWKGGGEQEAVYGKGVCAGIAGLQ